ncbi:MAG TPA: MarR family transcriptional regulator [Solirubrobacteraceae bacterium]|nr:MarR family transcriptional regulator [Solirubrobacteraceae bacterium]
MRHPKLEIIDALVQSSFVVQQILTEVGEQHDLSVIQIRLLGVLRDRQLRMAPLAAILGLSKSSTTGLVDRAERRALVQRVSVPVGDERAVHVTLSDEGRRLAQQGTAEIAERLNALAGQLSDSGRQHLARALTQLVYAAADSRGLDLRANLIKSTSVAVA